MNKFCVFLLCKSHRSKTIFKHRGDKPFLRGYSSQFYFRLYNYFRGAYFMELKNCQKAKNSRYQEITDLFPFKKSQMWSISVNSSSSDLSVFNIMYRLWIYTRNAHISKYFRVVPSRISGEGVENSVDFQLTKRKGVKNLQ